MTSLAGKSVLIVGASSGIGRGIARALARDHGVKLALAARRKDALHSLVEELKVQAGAGKAKMQDSFAVPMDATQRAAVQSGVDQVKTKFGTVDVVINCAGVMYFTLMKNMKWDEWERTVDTNCKGTMNSVGACLPIFLSQKSGHVVNITSDAARQTFPALTVYNASKAFAHEFTKGLRCELVGTGVRVTEILPGDVRTNLIVQNSDNEAAEKVGVKIGAKIGGTDSEFEATCAKDASTRNCYLDPEDIAQAVMYALTAPGHVGVNEVLVEPRDQMFGDPTSMSM